MMAIDKTLLNDGDYLYLYRGMKKILNEYNFLYFPSSFHVRSLAREVMENDLNEANNENKEKVLCLYFLLEDYFRNRKTRIVDYVGERFFEFYNK